jgi:hypothetical protein
VPRSLAFALLLAATLAAPAHAQSYLPRAQMVGGNPGPAHNYVCPNVEKTGSALDCYLDAVAHLYRMCRHVKSIEIIEHGYENAEAGTNSAKSESCVDKQKNNISRPYQAALREASVSRQAVDGLRSLHDFWLTALAALKWRSGESDDDYKHRTGSVFDDLGAKAEGVRTIVATVRERAPKTAATAREKAPR